MVSSSSKLKFLLPNKKLFVFDFDGVIADSNHIKTEAFKNMFKDFGESISEKVVKHHESNASMSRFDKFKYYYRNYLNTELTEDRLKGLAQEFSDIVLEKIISSPEIEGSTKFLKQLSKLGKICAINSATPHEEINFIVKERKLSNLFKKV